jgi:hypothetical protein
VSFPFDFSNINTPTHTNLIRVIKWLSVVEAFTMPYSFQLLHHWVMCVHYCQYSDYLILISFLVSCPLLPTLDQLFQDSSWQILKHCSKSLKFKWPSHVWFISFSNVIYFILDLRKKKKGSCKLDETGIVLIFLMRLMRCKEVKRSV